MTVIGLVGEKGGGKGTFVNILKELNPDIVHLRSSDLLLEIAGIVGINKEQVSRKQFQELAVDLEKIFGKGCISRGMHKKISKYADSNNIVVFDGVRWPTDVAVIQSFRKNFLVHITAPPEIRYNRLKNRNEKAGENIMTYEQFLAEEKAETERQIPIIGAKANYWIINESATLNEFKKIALPFAQHILNAPR